ncbi:MAG: STAS domain-containing protein [Microscillaceae bacterium]|jgi:anti-sigma B factor antagonist|nr:STAS domain-containing protein [Microscillaceae bacterium]
MKFLHQIKNNVLLLRFEENLIVATAPLELIHLIDECLQNQVVYCAVDLSSIRLMNSSGIGILMRILTKFRAKDGEVVLINPSLDISKLLIITKLNAIFTIVKTEDEAIDILKNPIY